MAKTKIWFKKRTTRGGGREVRGRARLSQKNAVREIYKNQRWYSHFLLKFAICAVLAIFWVRVDFAILGFAVTIFPVGFVLGLIVLALEKNSRNRWIEFLILLAFAGASYVWAIGVVI